MHRIQLDANIMKLRRTYYEITSEEIETSMKERYAQFLFVFIHILYV